jgi:predicted nucleic acid-binding protein
MFPVDTNVWLERLLDRERSAEVGDFLDRLPSERLFITDFALHSIGLVLSRLNRLETLMQFVNDTFVHGAVILIHLRPEDTLRLLHAMEQFGLDFDDAYQYVATEKHRLTLVGFDGDFDRTEGGRKTPADILDS